MSEPESAHSEAMVRYYAEVEPATRRNAVGFYALFAPWFVPGARAAGWPCALGFGVYLVLAGISWRQGRAAQRKLAEELGEEEASRIKRGAHGVGRPNHTALAILGALAALGATVVAATSLAAS